MSIDKFLNCVSLIFKTSFKQGNIVTFEVNSKGPSASINLEVFFILKISTRYGGKCAHRSSRKSVTRT